MTRFNSFMELANDTLCKIKSFDITSKTVMTQFRFCVKNLKSVMDKHDVIFDKELAMEWLSKFNHEFTGTSQSKKARCQYHRRTILLLDDNYHEILTTWKVYKSVHQEYPKSLQYLNILDKYEFHLKESNYAAATIYFKCLCAKNTLLYLEHMNIFDIKNCTHKVLASYFASARFKNRKPSGVQAEIIRTRHFIAFLEDNEYVEYKNLHCVPPTLHVVDRHIITVLTDDMVEVLLKDFTGSPANLRDKAAYLLALHCGLRSSDIIGLKFSNIDWENKIIHIIQKKTDSPLDIPVDDETLNAIIKYILEERRECELDYIFISSIGYKRKLINRPFHTLNRFKPFALTNEPAQYGLHIMRRTFASKLLKSGSSLSVISSALGQIDKNCINEYLSTDEVAMKRCALEIEDIPYKGGRF